MKLKILGLPVICFAVLIACQPNRGTTAPQIAPSGPATPASATPAPAAADQGGISGGGTFLIDMANPVLAPARKELAAQLRAASPQLFKSLPAGWTPERIAQLIDRAIESPTKNKEVRKGSRLMLDYRLPPEEPAIEMLEPFYAMVAAVKISTDGESRVRAIRSIKLQLLHEVAHYWVGADDTRADRVAESILLALLSDRWVCAEDFSAGTDARNAPELLVLGQAKPNYKFEKFLGDFADPSLRDLSVTARASKNYEYLKKFFQESTAPEILDRDKSPYPVLSVVNFSNVSVDQSTKITTLEKCKFSVDEQSGLPNEIPGSPKDGSTEQACVRLSLNRISETNATVALDLVTSTGTSQTPTRNLSCEHVGRAVKMD